MNPVGTIIGGGTDEFNRPADTTAYTVGDRIAEATTDTGTTVLRKLFTAKRPRSKGVITKLILTTSLKTFVDTVRIHFYTVAQPATAIPGDNAAMGEVYANRAQHLGFLDFPALAAPTLAGSSDVAQAILANQSFGFTCAVGDAAIYYALQDQAGGGTPASAQSFHLRTETKE